MLSSTIGYIKYTFCTLLLISNCMSIMGEKGWHLILAPTQQLHSKRTGTIREWGALVKKISSHPYLDLQFSEN